MLIENKWYSSYDKDIDVKENNSLKNLSSQWSSQISVTITKPSIILKGPIKYTMIKKK